MKVCRGCFDGFHCRSKECECRCKELTPHHQLHTPSEWQEIYASEADIRAAMRQVEQRWQEKA